MRHAYRIDGREVDSGAFYGAACDPRRSIVVEACAGAGKTWMLVSRILRALLDGAQPHEILALTFTRKAAGEMRSRLNQWLREFSCAGEPDAARLEGLATELRQRGLAAATAQALAPALGALHAQVLQSGRTVAIRSFHAWFAQLLAAAPLELLRGLGLPSQPGLVEDPGELRDELFARFHATVQADPALRERYIGMIRRRRLHRVTQWLETAWHRRIEFERADAAGTLQRSVPAAAELWTDCAGLATPAALVQRAPLSPQLAALAGELGTQTTKTARNAADALNRALTDPDPHTAHAAMVAALMTAKREPRRNMGELPAHAALCDALIGVQDRLDQQEAHDEHSHLVVLARVLLAEYRALKQRRGLADMGDLETAALALLADPALSGWVQQRLDTRLKHLLIDEFQDTSPLQWQALLGWLSAYAGAGGGASGQRPLSVFIVGDPKQSIYRFRRAEPRVFEAARHFVVEGLEGALLECDHTRRCAPELTGALNAVFGAASARGEWPGFRTHTTAADGLAGQLLRLPDVLRPPKVARGKAQAPVWRDTLTEARHEPDEQLRAQEAHHVAQAIAALVATGRRPKDIMVLARKRVALRAVSEALSALQLPHVMPEAMDIGDAPEAQDLLAVLDVLASNGHDLALARALRSPVFGATDEDLLALSQAARSAGSAWWTALIEHATPWGGALERARTLLRGWAEAMAWLPPHDLLDRIVHEADVVARIAAAAPTARRAMALQTVDALLAAALQVDGARYASPYGFVRALRSRKVEAALVPAADAVALLTIHGAKGLEAPVVFVVDCDPAPTRGENGTLLVDWPVDAGAPASLAFVASEAAVPPSLRALHEAELAAREREELNGLYVAMTRAAELLVISRTEPHLDSAAPTWWDRVHALAQPWAGAAPAATPFDEEPICVPELPALVRASTGASAGASTGASGPAIDTRAPESPAAALGSALHRVLEWAVRPGAPMDPVATLRAAAAAARAFGLEPARAANVQQLATQVLASAECRRFFDPRAFAWAGNEVPVVVHGQPGRIDRLVAFDEADGRTWWVLDYKLQAAPGDLEANRTQLAGYVDAVRALQPADRVCGAFITAGGRLVIDTQGTGAASDR